MSPSGLMDLTSPPAKTGQASPAALTQAIQGDSPNWDASVCVPQCCAAMFSAHFFRSAHVLHKGGHIALSSKRTFPCKTRVVAFQIQGNAMPWESSAGRVIQGKSLALTPFPWHLCSLGGWVSQGCSARAHAGGGDGGSAGRVLLCSASHMRGPMELCSLFCNKSHSAPAAATLLLLSTVQLSFH